MKIELIDWTKDPDGLSDSNYSASILEYIYQTKTKQNPENIKDIRENISDSKIQDTLANIKKDNLDSCFEFLNLTFCFQDITRQFLPELMKIKSTNIAFEEPRLSAPDFHVFTMPETLLNPVGANDVLKEDLRNDFISHTNSSNALYDKFKLSGVSAKDSLSMLPECRTTNAVVRIDLRMYLYAVSKRSSPNFSGEFKEAIDKTLEIVSQKYSWLGYIFQNQDDDILTTVQTDIKAVYDSGQPMSQDIYNLLLNKLSELKG